MKLDNGQANLLISSFESFGVFGPHKWDNLITIQFTLLQIPFCHVKISRDGLWQNYRGERRRCDKLPIIPLWTILDRQTMTVWNINRGSSRVHCQETDVAACIWAVMNVCILKRTTNLHGQNILKKFNYL